MARRLGLALPNRHGTVPPACVPAPVAWLLPILLQGSCILRAHLLLAVLVERRELMAGLLQLLLGPLLQVRVDEVGWAEVLPLEPLHRLILARQGPACDTDPRILTRRDS